MRIASPADAPLILIKGILNNSSYQSRGGIHIAVKGCWIVDINRAQEIIDSSEQIDVRWNGESVWIDSVDPNRETVHVHAENDPSDHKSVPVNQLTEV